MRELSLHRTALQSYKPDPRRRGTTVKTTRALAALVAVLGLLVLPVTAVAQARYSPVTDQRLVTPEPENWLQIRGNYQGWGYSPLSQITTGNVRRLTPVWAFSTGVDSGHEAPPLVNNGVMFVPTPYSQVIALDAKTGKLLGDTSGNCPRISRPCTTRAAGSPCTAIRCTWRAWTAI